LNGGYGVEIAGLGKLVERFLAHAIALGVGQLLVDVGEPLGGDVLFVVERPDLILPFVGDAGVLGPLHPDLQLTKLVGEPRGSLGGGLILTAEILLDVGDDMGVDDAGGELGSVDSKLTSIKRLLGTRFTLRLPKNSASSAGVSGLPGCRWRLLPRVRRVKKIPAGRKTVVANGLKGKSLAGEDPGLRLDVILKIHHVVIGIRALEGRILAFSRSISTRAVAT